MSSWLYQGVAGRGGYPYRLILSSKPMMAFYSERGAKWQVGRNKAGTKAGIVYLSKASKLN